MTTAASVEHHEEAGDGHHDHGHHEHHDGPFIAHHFESAEQQFDSGKLGMWLFLVQEILFFSGLFVAYIIYRNHNPEIFEAAHVHLDKWLGGLNTIVLLFSSLTMAWAVRCAQLGKNMAAVVHIVITMVCANIFLGVKAIEYTHKWEMGLFWANYYTYGQPQPDHPPYLMYISAPFIVCTLVAAFLATVSRVRESDFWFKFFLCITISFLGYFIGLGIAWAMPSSGHDDHHGGHGSHAVHAAADGHEEGHEEGHGKEGHGDSHDESHGKDDGHGHANDADHAEPGTDSSAAAMATADEPQEEPDLGGFFSIYYAMTGLHAIHILAGVVALTWLLYRTLAMHFRPNYFGPVENVGLYWHLVDLIWIYLFPMMYLIH